LDPRSNVSTEFCGVLRYVAIADAFGGTGGTLGRVVGLEVADGDRVVDVDTDRFDEPDEQPAKAPNPVTVATANQRVTRS
jgi:hypothetical protein